MGSKLLPIIFLVKFISTIMRLCLIAESKLAIFMLRKSFPLGSSIRNRMSKLAEVD